MTMLIEHYDLDVFTPPHEAGVEKFSAIARLTADISEVLPYLNATCRGAVYQRAANALTWKKGEHHLTFYAYQIATGNVADYETAVAEIDELVTLINRTWERRAEITPDYETRRRPPVMTIYKRLPQTNCRQCGEPTCYAFAIKLAASQRTLADCRPLYEPPYADQLAALRDLVDDTPEIE
jgi:ArsR family metal-binding transcriptional regulator